MDPSERNPLAVFTSQSGLAFQIEVGAFAPSGSPGRFITISVPIKPNHDVDVYGRITTAATRRAVNVFADIVPRSQSEAYRKWIPLAPGAYHADIIVKDAEAGVTESGLLDFEVK
jgi:hypothetical protein